MKPQKLSAIVIAKNEEYRIEACLEALSFCDELVVIDNGSTDKTSRYAAKRGAKVFGYETSNFAGARNFGKEKSSGDWLLYIDADEIVSPQLARSIKAAIVNLKPENYTLRRNNYYLGHQWPTAEQMLRLFQKNSLSRWEGELHESAITSGGIGHLEGELIHNTHRSLEEMVQKTNLWSDTEAKLRFDAHHPPVVWWRLLHVMWIGFSNSYFKQSGWRAGAIGLIESMYQGFSMFITYAKLWELQKKNT